MFLNQGGNSKNSRKKLKIWEDFAPPERPSGVIKKPDILVAYNVFSFCPPKEFHFLKIFFSPPKRQPLVLDFVKVYFLF